MKAIFFIFLLSLVYNKTTFETVKCIAQNEKIINQVANIIDTLKTEDFGKLFLNLFQAFFIVKDEVEKCLNEEEPVPKINPKPEPTYNPFKLEDCKMKCGDYYYDYKCVQNCEELYGDGFGFDPNDILNNN